MSVTKLGRLHIKVMKKGSSNTFFQAQSSKYLSEKKFSCLSFKCMTYLCMVY